MIRAALLAALAIVSLLVIAGCGGDDGGERSVEGIITDVQSSTLTQVDSFTVRSNDAETFEFRVAPDARPEPQEGFVPGHMRSHIIAAEQVRVYYREEGGELLATRMVHPEE